jgi:DNA-binding CsgD family transcriptional regulator
MAGRIAVPRCIVSHARSTEGATTAPTTHEAAMSRRFLPRERNMANDIEDSDGLAGRAGKPITRQASKNDDTARRAASRFAAIFEQFSDREKRILRLAAKGFISKEIAGYENDSENAIHQVIKRARAKCGDISRRELVRAYADWEKTKPQILEEDGESGSGSERTDHFLVDQNPVLVGRGEPAPEAMPDHRDDAPWRSAAGALSTAGTGSPYISLHLPVGIGGSGRNDLGKDASSTAILLIATVSVLFAGAILMLLNAADHLQIGP